MIRSRFKNFLFLIKRIGFYIPFTIYLILFGFVSWFGYRWLQNAASIPDSSYKDIFLLLLSLALWVGSCILCLGIFSVCFAYVFFKWNQRKHGTTFRINTSAEQQESTQTVSLLIHPILQPLLGYIRIRLNYDQRHFSKKFDLVKTSKGKLINTTLEGVYSWDLAEIREYRVEKAIIYFEDFFQFFSFATSVATDNSFYTPPKNQDLKKMDALPRKTEDQTVRIPELKKIEGEYINYKNFESSDDVRRIVWKIYAKNKELVVRIPEIIDPYASHIYLYPSFFSAFDIKGNEVAEAPFLNYYKTICWSLYEQLKKKKEFEIRYVSDQEIPQISGSVEEQVKYAVTLSAWQNQKDLKSYFNASETALVLISSLSDPAHVNELLEKYGNSVSFIFVPLTESLNNLNFAHWLQWIFVEQEKDKTAAYRTAWKLSALRFKIEQNEKELTKLLKDTQKIISL